MCATAGRGEALCAGSDRLTPLTHNDEDKHEGGHPRGDVEHDSDVVGQLVRVVHIRHENGWKHKPYGTAQLQQSRAKSGTQPRTHLSWPIFRL